ncbi:MAG TPA: class I SAM-dependent methyltransferase [Anaerolineae bacterium]|nr:class I SAM-dependent methyltransferase [Anaerolineae bacterium]
MSGRPPVKDYLVELLDRYWFAPPVALWRAVELRTAAEETYPRPLLDLGCGDGLIAGALFGPEGVDVGLDPWAEQVRKAARSGVYRWVQRADGHRMPYADGSFATVFSNSVLEHIPDPLPVLREASRVLRHAGRFIFTVPSDAFRSLLHGYRVRWSRGDPEGAERYAAGVDARLAHHHYHTPNEWADLLARVGMRLETARYYVPEPVERLWDRMNGRYGIDRWSPWRVLASPRLRRLGYQRLLRRWVVARLSQAWRPYYEMDVPPGEKGGGLLIVARKGAVP